MDIYEARWKNAKRIAERIKEMQDKGWLVFDEDRRIVHKFSIEKNRDGEECIVERYSGSFSVNYFVNDKYWDEGLYTTIAEYNKRFRDWKCIDPKNIVPLLLE